MVVDDWRLVAGGREFFLGVPLLEGISRAYSDSVPFHSDTLLRSESREMLPEKEGLFWPRLAGRRPAPANGIDTSGTRVRWTAKSMTRSPAPPGAVYICKNFC
jgi:hypothetical protein